MIHELSAPREPKSRHELCGGFGDVSGLAEVLGIGHAMVGIVRRSESGEFLRMGHPVEVAGIHDRAAHAGAVTVHIFGGGVRDDIHAILEWTTVDWCGERVIDDQWHAVAVRCVRELFEIKNDERRIGDGFAEDRLGVRLECRFEFFLGAVRAYERAS